MKKTFKLTRNALMLIGIIILIIIISIVLNFGSADTKEVKLDKPEKISSLVLENQILKVELLDFVGSKDYNDDYQEVSLKIKKGEEVLGYKIAENEKFDKVMQLLPPDKKTKFLNSSEKPTHEAYVLVLMGDIVEYKNSEGKRAYRVVNARLEHYQQSLVLENNYDSVYIASIDGKKEKMVKIKSYQQALSNPNEYMNMLQW